MASGQQSFIPFSGASKNDDDGSGSKSNSSTSNNSPKEQVIAVDKSGLYPKTTDKVEKVKQSPLGQQLYDFIQKVSRGMIHYHLVPSTIIVFVHHRYHHHHHRHYHLGNLGGPCHKDMALILAPLHTDIS